MPPALVIYLFINKFFLVPGGGPVSPLLGFYSTVFVATPIQVQTVAQASKFSVLTGTGVSNLV